MLYGKVFPKKYNMTQPYNSGREKYYYNQLRLKPGKMATIENLLMLVFVSHANDVVNNLSNFNMTHILKILRIKHDDFKCWFLKNLFFSSSCFKFVKKTFTFCLIHLKTFNLFWFLLVRDWYKVLTVIQSKLALL